MRRAILSAIFVTCLCAVAASVEPNGNKVVKTNQSPEPTTRVEVGPIEPAKTVKVDPLITKLESVQAELVESKKLVAALQRRLRASESERTEAQTKLVLMTDDLIRLSEELEAARKGK